MSETHQQNAAMKYCPDIDGVRAVAILSVMACHNVSLLQATCGSDRCVAYADDKNETPMLKDQDQLTEEGPKFLVRRLYGFGEMNGLSRGRRQSGSENQRVPLVRETDYSIFFSETFL
jgi:hypothetical protein